MGVKIKTDADLHVFITNSYGVKIKTVKNR